MYIYIIKNNYRIQNSDTPQVYQTERRTAQRVDAGPRGAEQDAYESICPEHVSLENMPPIYEEFSSKNLLIRFYEPKKLIIEA